MGSERDACSIYCQGCSSKRGKKKRESSTAPSFFKIMLGKTYDVAMVVPPTVSEKLKPFIHLKKVVLKDPEGRKWYVHVSDSEGSLAFEMGWRKFVRGNGVELGDFLDFSYIGGSRFLVDIYSSNGCQKVFPRVWRMRRTDKKKKAKTGTSSIPKKRPYDSFYEQSARQKKDRVKRPFEMARDVPSQCNIQRTLKVVPVSKTLEDPCFMTSRETNFDKEDDRDHLFDLSAFERRGKKPTTSREKSSSLVSDNYSNAETEAFSTDTHTCPTPKRNTDELSGGTTRPIKHEAKEWKPHIKVEDEHSVSEQIKVYCVGKCCKNFNSTVNSEAHVDMFVKPEPVDDCNSIG